MEDEEWENPTNTSSKAVAPQSSTSTSSDNAQQTLKITDGYKYSYEALTSPANVEDWVDPPSYGSSKRMPNGFSQSSYRDSGKPFKNDRNDSYKRFEKRNSSYSNPSGDFATPKPSRYSGRPLPNVNPVDWDAPVNNPATPINGSFNVNVPMTAEDAWDALGAGTPQSITHHKSTPIATFSQTKSVSSKNTDDDWDNPGLTSNANVIPPAEVPTYRPSSVASMSMHSTHSEPLNVKSSQPTLNDDDENWDDPGTPKSTSHAVMPTFRPSSANSFKKSNEEDWDAGPSTANADNGFSKNIPAYTSSDDPYSSSRGYDSNWQANKYARPRNFDSNDHFSRDPYSRHSRGNFRNNTYDRGSRGSRGTRGSRGGRGGRDGRDGREGRDFNPSYSSRDSSRNRGDRDKSYSQNSFSKSSDRPYQAPVSFNNTVVTTEDNWDGAPSGASKGPTEKTAASPAQILPSPSVPHLEESWD